MWDLLKLLCTTIIPFYTKIHVILFDHVADKILALKELSSSLLLLLAKSQKTLL